MDKRKVVNFESKERLLKKAAGYIESMELFLEEKDQAIPLLLKALKHANLKLKRKIVLLLGGFAKHKVAWPLYQMMIDPEQDDEIRHLASIQLSVTLPFLEERRPLIDELLQSLNSPDPELRMHAAFALGWEGNDRAAIPLIELLYDPDIQVQQTAVNALSNLRDDRILNLLLERLEHGPLEQKRCILFNLGRFYSKQKEVQSVYLEYLEHQDADLRFDALLLFKSITEPEENMGVYHKCLSDSNPRIRALALKCLDEVSPAMLSNFKTKIKEMLSDPEIKIKQTAIKIMKKTS
jgi:HEAT repeat protein